MSLSSHLINTLKQLGESCLDYKDLRRLSKDFFDFVYKIAISEYTYTAEEKSIIGDLLQKALVNLEFYFSVRVDEYDSHSGLISKYDRSSLQFLLDNYKDFPVTHGEKLKDCLPTIIDSDDLDQWNLYLFNYIEGEVDPVVNGSSKELSKIPETHWWWFK